MLQLVKETQNETPMLAADKVVGLKTII